MMNVIPPNVKVVHIEPTESCQAECSFCEREINPFFDKNTKVNLTIDQIQKHLSMESIMGLNKIFMCGNYGDPAAGKTTVDIYKFFRSINPSITLGMNTNGGIKSESWWSDLGLMFNQPTDYVVFSIDGLEDTNEIYRKNVNWRKLMANAEAYISTGANAHWDMLVYKHNEHQVQSCEQLARDMGFTWFRAKVSHRGFNQTLRKPTGWVAPTPGTGAIKCIAMNDESIFIDALGNLHRCCWLGANRINYDFDEVQKSWETKSPYITCSHVCRTSDNKNLFENQWRYEAQLK